MYKVQRSLIPTLIAVALMMVVAVSKIEAQSIMGKVFDEQGHYVVGANVVIDATKGWSAIVDVEGKYTLNVPAGTYTITFRAVGKKEIKKTATLNEGANCYVNVTMANSNDSDYNNPVEANAGNDETYKFNADANYILAGEMTPKAAFLYATKIFQEDVSKDAVVKNYLKNFDKYYKAYSNNEFELVKKIQQARRELTNDIQNLKFNNIYTAVFRASLGQYDFNNKGFQFNPFQYNSQVYLSDYPYGGVQGDYYSPVGFYLKNTGIQHLKMNEADADRLLKSLPTESTYSGNKTNRTVYVKAYYSLYQEAGTNNSDYSTNSQKINCYLHKVEVYSDKCATNNKIATVNSTYAPPTYSGSMHAKFLSDTKNGVVLNQEMKYIQPNQGQIMLSSIGRINGSKECTQAHYKVVTEFKKVDEGAYKLIFTIQTNAGVGFFPGYFYTLTDKAGQDFPFVVHTINFVDRTYNSDGGLKSITISVETNIKERVMRELAANGIKKLKIQVAGTQERPSTGSGYGPQEGSIKVTSSEWFAWDINDYDSNQFSALITKTLK